MIFPVSTKYFRDKEAEKKQQEKKKAEQMKAAMDNLRKAIDTKLYEYYRGFPLEIKFNFIDLKPSDIVPLLLEYRDVWDIKNPSHGVYTFIARDSNFTDNSPGTTTAKPERLTLDKLAEIIDGLSRQEGFMVPEDPVFKTTKL
jgi:hypothetical protein